MTEIRYVIKVDEGYLNFEYFEQYDGYLVTAHQSPLDASLVTNAELGYVQKAFKEICWDMSSGVKKTSNYQICKLGITYETAD